MYLLIPCCLLLAGLYIRLQQKKRFVPALLLKSLASLCFVALGFLCAAGAGRLVLAGLVLGCVADVLLGLRTVFEKGRQKLFLLGGVVFLGGHVLYLAAVWPSVRSRSLCVLLSVLATFCLLRLLLPQLRAGRALKCFGGVYFSVFVLLNTAAVCRAAAEPGAFSLLFAAGVFLFLCSDILLNLYSFGPRRRFGTRVLYCVLYYLGQLAIALSLRFL